MFYEYALEPSLLSNWKDFRYFTERCGWYEGRLIARYPKRWKRLVYDSLRGCGEIERKRIEERLRGINAKLVKRVNAQYDGEQTWLGNAVAEHGRKPFHAILAVANPTAHPDVLLGDDVDEARWNVSGEPVLRLPAEFAAQIALLLRASHTVAFIDPHFAPTAKRFTAVFEAFLSVVFDASSGGRPPEVQLHVGIKYLDIADEVERKQAESRVVHHRIAELQKYLPSVIPSGEKVTASVWKEKDGGDKLHNRYVLTDVGGVSFGIGLDSAEEGVHTKQGGGGATARDDAKGTTSEREDIQRLEESKRAFRWQQYIGSSPAFLLLGRAEIIGTG